MSTVVPTRMTAHFVTTIDPLTGLPEIVLSFGVAEKGADGIYRGKGTVAVTLQPGTTYTEIDPVTGSPLPRTISGFDIAGALYGLFQEAWANR